MRQGTRWVTSRRLRRDRTMSTIPIGAASGDRGWSVSLSRGVAHGASYANPWFRGYIHTAVKGSGEEESCRPKRSARRLLR